MLKAVLFDLDGTLLDIDLDPFLRDYFALLGPVVAQLIGAQEPSVGLGAVIHGTQAMSDEHPGLTNRDAFNRAFAAMTGVDLSEPHPTQVLEAFYRDTFPRLENTHGPMNGAGEAVRVARELGLRTALATNPIFPRAAIEERARWAGLALADFDFVTSYEAAPACKPSSAYFDYVAESLGVSAAECLMVGDDTQLDLPATATGMRTYYVGVGDGASADWSGDLTDLAALLPTLLA